MADRNTSRAYSRRKYIAITGLGLAAGTAGCTSDGGGNGSGGGGGNGTVAGAAGESKEVTIINTETDEKSVQNFNKAISTWEEDTGHTVNVNYIDFDQASQRIASLMSAGDPPEIIYMTQLNVGQYINDPNVKMADVGGIYSDLKDKIGTPKEIHFTPGSEGTKHTLPVSVNLQDVTVRRDLVEEAGFEFPSMEDRFGRSWGDNVEWVEAMNDLTNHGMIITASETTKGTLETIQWMWAHGTEIWQGDIGNIELTIHKGKNRKRAIETLNHLKELYQYAPNGSNISWVEAQETFSAGQTGEVNYTVGRLRDVALSANQPWAEDVYPTEIPQVRRRSDGISTSASSQGFAQFANAENLNAARSFLRHYFNNDYHIDFLTQVPYHRTPPTETIAQSDAYLSHPEIEKRPDIVEFKSKQLEYGAPIMKTAQGGVNPYASIAYVEGTLGTLAGQVLVNDMDPGDAIDQIVPELQSQME